MTRTGVPRRPAPVVRAPLQVIRQLDKVGSVFARRQDLVRLLQFVELIRRVVRPGDVGVVPKTQLAERAFQGLGVGSFLLVWFWIELDWI